MENCKDKLRKMKEFQLLTELKADKIALQIIFQIFLINMKIILSSLGKYLKRRLNSNIF